MGERNPALNWVPKPLKTDDEGIGYHVFPDDCFEGFKIPVLNFSRSRVWTLRREGCWRVYFEGTPNYILLHDGDGDD